MSKKSRKQLSLSGFIVLFAYAIHPHPRGDPFHLFEYIIE